MGKGEGDEQQKTTHESLVRKKKVRNDVYFLFCFVLFCFVSNNKHSGKKRGQ